MGGKRAKQPPQPAPAAPKGGAEAFERLRTSWTGARDIFFPLRLVKPSKDYKSIDEVLSPLVPLADIRLAIIIILISGAITTFLAFATTFESMQLANFASDALTQVTGVAQESLTMANLAPLALFQFLLYVPLSLAVTLVYEGLAFAVMKATGGKGTFAQQLYLASVVGLSMSFASALSLFAPLPCLQIVAGLALVVITLYLLLYVEPKAYMLIHGLGFWHTLAVTILLTVPKLVVLAFATNFLALAMGFPAPINYPSGV